MALKIFNFLINKKVFNLEILLKFYIKIKQK